MGDLTCICTPNKCPEMYCQAMEMPPFQPWSGCTPGRDKDGHWLLGRGVAVGRLWHSLNINKLCYPTNTEIPLAASCFTYDNRQRKAEKCPILQHIIPTFKDTLEVLNGSFFPISMRRNKVRLSPPFIFLLKCKILFPFLSERLK